MKYRSFKDEIKLSQLGFGTMRLPILHQNEKLIDEAAATTCLRQAIDGGVNYIDTAWPYHKQASEPFVGRFLQSEKLRDQVYLATKLPCWECHTPESFDAHLDEQLQRLKTDHIDFYLLHALDGYRFSKISELGIIDFLDRAKASGKIRYAGFSFHDRPEAFEPILNAYPFDFVQIQLNYMDEDFQAGLKGLRAAHEKGCAVMIMEPLRGGQLATASTPALQELWASSDCTLTPAELAFKYLYNMPEVTCVLSGMGTTEAVKENLETASRYGISDLTDSDRAMIERLRTFYREHIKIECTACGYCTVCPKIIPIPSIFKYYNESFMYDDAPRSRMQYKKNIKNKFKANQCIECGECEAQCPQHLPIRETLKAAHSFLNES